MVKKQVDLEVSIQEQAKELQAARTEMHKAREKLADLVAEFATLAMQAQRKELRDLSALAKNEAQQEETKKALRRAEAACNVLQAELDRATSQRDAAKLSEYSKELEGLEAKGRELNREFAKAAQALVQAAEDIYVTQNEMRYRIGWIRGAGLKAHSYREPITPQTFGSIDALCKPGKPGGAYSGTSLLAHKLQDHPEYAGGDRVSSIEVVKNKVQLGKYKVVRAFRIWDQQYSPKDTLNFDLQNQAVLEHIINDPATRNSIKPIEE